MKDFINIKLLDIYPQINLLKSSQKPYYTNLYSYANIAYKAKLTQNSILLFKEEKSFFRLYFFTTNPLELENLILELEHKKNICIEILQKQNQNIFHNLKPQATYLHLRKRLLPLKIPTTLKSSQINPKTLLKHLKKDFNQNFDHLPTLRTVRSWTKNNQVLSLKNKNKIYSYLVFSLKGKTAYLNFIVNNYNKQSLLDIWSLFYQTLITFDVKSIHLWCNSDNSKALNMYKKENFLSDNLKDYIYIKTSKTNGGGGDYKKPLNNPYFRADSVLKVS